LHKITLDERHTEEGEDDESEISRLKCREKLTTWEASVEENDEPAIDTREEPERGKLKTFKEIKYIPSNVQT
jgi:hypothetical protein